MQIDLIYSNANPAHIRTRDMVMQYITERGILAHISMHDAQVECPQVVIDGVRIVEHRRHVRPGMSDLYPTVEIIERIIEERAWGM